MQAADPMEEINAACNWAYTISCVDRDPTFTDSRIWSKVVSILTAEHVPTGMFDTRRLMALVQDYTFDSHHEAQCKTVVGYDNLAASPNIVAHLALAGQIDAAIGLEDKRLETLSRTMHVYTQCVAGGPSLFAGLVLLPGQHYRQTLAVANHMGLTWGETHAQWLSRLGGHKFLSVLLPRSLEMATHWKQAALVLLVEDVSRWDTGQGSKEEAVKFVRHELLPFVRSSDHDVCAIQAFSGLNAFGSIASYCAAERLGVPELAMELLQVRRDEMGRLCLD